MDADLMGASGFEPAGDQARWAETLHKAPMGDGAATAILGRGRHFFAMPGMAGDRRIDFARRRVEAAPDERQIFALERSAAAVIGEEIGEASMSGVGLGDDQKAGRVLVEPMDDSRTFDPADAREAPSAMMDERIDQRAPRVAGRRMNDETGRLVDHNEMLVLIDDVERQVLAEQRRLLGFRRLEGDSHAYGEPHRRIARDRAVDPNFALLDQRFESGARERNAPFRRRAAEVSVEPLSRARSVHLEDLRSGRRSQRRAAGGLRPGLAHRLVRLAPAAAFGLGVHTRSRRRLRPPVSATAGATSGPSAATIASMLGRGPPSWASSPRRIAATWAGSFPQQPPMMRAPQSTASPA